MLWFKIIHKIILHWSKILCSDGIILAEDTWPLFAFSRTRRPQFQIKKFKELNYFCKSSQLTFSLLIEFALKHDYGLQYFTAG